MAEKVVKKKKTKKKKHLIGPKEFLFNFLSLVCMIGVGIYFGYRSLYYYSKQNQKIIEEAQTLNGLVTQNTPVVYNEEVGLHHDSLGYYYRGNVTNNYVSFGNQLFRIMRIGEDNSVKLVSENYVGVFPWGNDSSFLNSNVYAWLNKTDWVHSGFYYNTLPKAQDYLVKTDYQINVLKDGKTNPLDEKYSDYISLLNVSDYILADGVNSYLFNKQYFFLLGYDENDQILHVEDDGSIQSGDATEGYGVRPVITMKPNTVVSKGIGTLEDPYVISIDKNPTFYGSYVKMGDDLWRVFYQDDKFLKLSLNSYLTINGEEIARKYSQNDSIYDIISAANIGYYLNKNYLNNLAYKDYLLPFPSFVGEISEDQGYIYANIFNTEVNAAVGLLNIFDPIVNISLEDYFHVNNTSSFGGMQYIRTSNGLLAEADVSENKHIVPVVCIEQSHIVGGNGTLEDPYVVG